MTQIDELKLDFSKLEGLIPVVVQNSIDGEILMVGFMNEAAWDKTQSSGLVTFWSRSRETLWTKGETSGDTLELKKVWVDCDEDTLLIQAKPNGPTCHTGSASCFYREIKID